MSRTGNAEKYKELVKKYKAEIEADEKELETIDTSCLDDIDLSCLDEFEIHLEPQELEPFKTI